MDVHPTKNGMYRYWSIAICVEANLGISGRFASYSCPVSGPGRHSVSARGWMLQSPWCLTQSKPCEKRWEHLRYHNQTSSEKAARGWFDLANKVYFDDLTLLGKKTCFKCGKSMINAPSSIVVLKYRKVLDDGEYLSAAAATHPCWKLGS